MLIYHMKNSRFIQILIIILLVIIFSVIFLIYNIISQNLTTEIKNITFSIMIVALTLLIILVYLFSDRRMDHPKFVSISYIESLQIPNKWKPFIHSVFIVNLSSIIIIVICVILWISNDSSVSLYITIQVLAYLIAVTYGFLIWNGIIITIRRIFIKKN